MQENLETGIGHNTGSQVGPDQHPVSLVTAWTTAHGCCRAGECARDCPKKWRGYLLEVEVVAVGQPGVPAKELDAAVGPDLRHGALLLAAGMAVERP